MVDSLGEIVHFVLFLNVCWF